VTNRMTAAVGTALLSVVAAAVLAVGAGATIDGPCSASINGVNVKGQSSTSADGAIVVKNDAKVPVTMSASTPISQLQVSISMLGLSRTVKSGPAHGASWARVVDVGDYSFWGVGLYQVTGSSTGDGLACSGTAIVKVEGSPLSTPAGWVSLGLTIVGGLGIAGVALSALHGAGMVRSTLLGLVSGLVAALGATVLLQQFSVLFPTGQITIGMLALGAVLGVGLPLVTHMVGAHGHGAAKGATPVAHS
jgi:hypothetical protein